MMRFKSRAAHRFAESPLLQLRLPAWRSRLMALIILSSFGLLLGRSFYLQIINTDFLQEKGESRYRRDLEVSASRGRIADRHGDVLAISTPMKSVWAIPADARLTPQQTQALAQLLETIFTGADVDSQYFRHGAAPCCFRLRNALPWSRHKATSNIIPV